MRRDETEVAKDVTKAIHTRPNWSSEPGVLGRQRRLHRPQGESRLWVGEDCVLLCHWFRAACQPPPGPGRKQLGGK